MNIINKLTIRHILTHKKRTILTLLSIIVSVAMVTAVLVSVVSFMAFMKDSSEAYDGTWHIQLQYNSYPSQETIEEIAKYGKFYISGNETSMMLQNSNTSEAEFDFATDELINLRSIKIKNGTFPKDSSEALFTEDYIKSNDLNWKVGDKVDIQLYSFDKNKYETRSFTISGIAEGNVSYFDFRAGVSALEKQENNDDLYFVTLSLDHLDNSVYQIGEKLSNTTKSEDLAFNNDYIRFSGVIIDDESIVAIAIFAAVLILIVVVSSVFMIYDSFAVSYQERQKYLGMLWSIGATSRQRNSSIYFEGFLVGLIAIPLGIVSGIIGMSITFHAISGNILEVMSLPIDGLLKVHITPIFIVLIVLIGTLTIFISCFIPAKRANKTGIIDSIKGVSTVKVKSAKKLKASAFSSKIFGFEGNLASKNSKRNKKRSKSIVFALCLSMIMFLAVSNLSSMFAQTIKSEIGDVGADVSFSVLQKDYEKFKSYLKKQNEIKAFSTSITNYCILTQKDILSSQFLEEMFDSVKTDSFEKNDNLKDDDAFSVLVVSIDDDQFKEYLKQIGQNSADYFGGTISAVAFSDVVKQNNDKVKLIPAFSNDIGKSAITLNVESYPDDSGEEIFIQKDVQIKAVSGKVPNNCGLLPTNTPVLLLPLSALKDINSNEYVEVNIFSDSYETVRDEIKDFLGNESMDYFVTDYGSQVHVMNALLSIFKVFIYGFISLIALIAIINIINSISSSMNERKREFAMFKSVGMSHKALKKMIYVENMRYAIKSIIISFPISTGIHYLMYYWLTHSELAAIKFTPYPLYYILAAAAVILIIVVALLYSVDKLKNRSIIDDIRQE